jgi:NDP-sugar pyrophosphorylase family protein
MKAVILAAGDGNRMGSLTKDKPKALVQVLGMSLIERVLLTAKRAGIGEFLIVCCYLGEKLIGDIGVWISKIGLNTPSEREVEPPQTDIGQFFDLLRFENRSKLEELFIISQ